MVDLICMPLIGARTHFDVLALNIWCDAFEGRLLNMPIERMTLSTPRNPVRIEIPLSSVVPDELDSTRRIVKLCRRNRDVGQAIRDGNN